MEFSELPTDKQIILFDGVCNLCNASVQFVITHDTKDIFRFVSLQSELGISIVGALGIEVSKVDSIILYEPKVTYYYKAQAIFKIAKLLGGMYSCLGVFTVLPDRFSNLIYDYVAKNRYKWFGKKESCMVPTRELESRFLA